MCGAPIPGHLSSRSKEPVYLCVSWEFMGAEYSYAQLSAHIHRDSIFEKKGLTMRDRALTMGAQDRLDWGPRRVGVWLCFQAHCCPVEAQWPGLKYRAKENTGLFSYKMWPESESYLPCVGQIPSPLYCFSLFWDLGNPSCGDGV